MTIAEHVQGYDLGARIELFHLDLSSFGETSFFFTPGPEGGGVAYSVTFDEQVYTPFAIEATGFEVSAGGTLPRPELRAANISNLFTPLLVAHNDLLGAKLTRKVTFARFLDDGDDPDPTAFSAPDVYILNRKTIDDGEVIGWECVSSIDLEGATLPGRRMVRDYCSLTPRRWTGSAFDYTGATCPWGASAGQEQAYDVNGDPVGAVEEVFSKRLGSCCRVRFGQNATLPYAGFPGLARTRVQR